MVIDTTEKMAQESGDHQQRGGPLVALGGSVDSRELGRTALGKSLRTFFLVSDLHWNVCLIFPSGL